MRLSAAAAVQNGAFSDFLAAEIGEETNGMTLSLLSALTRQGVDPWREAERLAGLSEPKAVQALTAIIERALGSAAKDDDTPVLAAGILQLLPRPGRPAAAPTASPGRTTGFQGLLAGLQLPSVERLPWWAVIAMAVAVALIAGRLIG